MSADLQARLRDLGAALESPAVPDFSASIAGRLPARSTRRRARTLTLACAVVLAAGGSAMAVTPSRNAILHVLGLRGVRIERVQRLPPLPASAGERLGLGRRITLRAARHAAAFTALLPPRATAAYLAHDVAGGRISVLVGPALVIELHASAAPLFVKLVPQGTHTTFLRVNGGPGVYVFGAPHVVFFETPGGVVSIDRVRLAGNVLLWQQGPLTVRIEGTRTLAQALALAHSLH